MMRQLNRALWLALPLFLSLMVFPVLSYAVGADEQPQSGRQQTLIVVVGAAGAPEYGQQFQQWAARLESAAQQGRVELYSVGGTPGESSPDDQIDDVQRLQQLISEHGSVETTEPLWLVFLGHGSFDTRSARFNLRGPDVSAEELAEMCQNANRPLAIVAAFSCSAPFLNALSGPNRVVVTATKDGNQIQWNRFGDAFTKSLVTIDSDIDRDGQTSLLEAWLYASRRTAEFYSVEGRLATEHSLLDDNGDARGTRGELYDGFRPAESVKDPTTLDGKLAAKWHLVRSDEERQLTAEQRLRRDELETELELLKTNKDSMEEAEYFAALEPLLLELAKIYEAAANGLPADPTDTPAPDTPAPDTPAPDTPAPDTPAPDTPAPDTPATDTPAPDTPATDTPAPDTPATDTPATDTPATDTPAPDTPAA